MKLTTALLLTLSIGTATAATPIHIDAPFPRVDFTATPTPTPLSGNTASTPTGAWVAGAIGERSALALLRSDGSLDLVRYTDVDNAQPIGYLVTPPLGNALLATTADGGAFGFSSYVGGFGGLGCSLTRYAPDATMIWTVSACTDVPALGVDGTGALWIVGTDSIIERISPDGSHITPIEADDLVDEQSAFAANPSGDGLYRAKGVPASIELIDRNGQSHPVWSASAAMTSIDHLLVGSDANLYATGVVAGVPTFFSITPQGQLRWSVAGGGTGARTEGAALFSDNALGVIRDDGSVVKVASDGTLRFAKFSSSFSYCGEQVLTGVTITDCNATAAGSDLVVTFVDKDSKPVVERYTDAGAVIGTTTFGANAEISDIDALPDGSVIVSVVPDVVILAAGFARLDRTGAQLPLTALQGVIDDDSDPIASKHNSDGTDYLLTAGTTQRALSRIGSDGTVMWKQLLAQSNSYPPATIDSSSDRVCINDFANIDCFAASDGHLLYSLNPRPNYAWRILDDGSIAIVYAQATESTAAEYAIVAPNGTPVSSVQLSATFTQARFAINGSGMLIAADLSLSKKVYGYDRTGHLLYSSLAPIAYDGAQDGKPFLSADGTAVFVSYLGVFDTAAGLSYTLWALSPTGASLWVDQLTAGYGLYDLQFRGDTFFVSSSSFPGIEIHPRAQAFSLADGSLIWARDVDATHLNEVCETYGFAADFTSNATSPVVMTCSGLFQYQALMLDASNGNIMRDLRQNCGAGRCGYYGANAALFANGDLRIDVGVADARTGTRAYVYSIAGAATVPPTISLTQPGIDGAWYAPYESGQGFIFDYIGSNGTLFIPWFTYSNAPVTNPSGLAWYSLQGTLAAGATSADLSIYVTDPGVFDSGVVTGHAVGTAHLSLTDCNSGVLIYQFDAGAGGSISLSRLTPSTSACALTGGATVPAQNANAPAAGFDARQSGSWYDPNKSGQGVEMTIIPAGNGYAGLAFAAWFTFDPAGQSDDPINQHWFTLQGDLSTAAAGKVTLPIQRIIGGSLDGLPTHDASTIGSATLTFEGCDHAQLDYRFDASDVAHAFAGLTGHIDLVKIGGCTSP